MPRVCAALKAALPTHQEPPGRARALGERHKLDLTPTVKETRAGAVAPPGAVAPCRPLLLLRAIARVMRLARSDFVSTSTRKYDDYLCCWQITLKADVLEERRRASRRLRL
jgi:hypothetical protein